MSDSVVEQALETIVAMRQQEELSYSGVVVDYLSGLPYPNSASTRLDATTQTAAQTAAQTPPVDANCRFAMARWCNDIADYLHYQRETVAIALNCLDRFVSTAPNTNTNTNTNTNNTNNANNAILLDRSQYQLAAMTALYTSVKVHETQNAMSPQLVSTLSRGVHSPEAVVAMESKMLRAIRWRVNPPTPMGFVRSMVECLEYYTDTNDTDTAFYNEHDKKDTVSELARFQIETIANDYDFCAVDASSIALACTLNAMESVNDDNVDGHVEDYDGMLFDTALADFEATMGRTLMVDDSCIRDLRCAICEFMERNNSSSSIRSSDGVVTTTTTTATTTTTTTTIPMNTRGNSTKITGRVVETKGKHCDDDDDDDDDDNIHSSPTTVVGTSITAQI